MALIGGSSSKKTTNTYEQGTEFNEVGGSAIANYGSDNTYNVLDAGAIQGSFSLAEKSIGSVESVSRDAISSTASAAGSAVNSAVQATRTAIDKVVQNAESESGKLATKAGIFLLLALGGYVAIKRFT